MQRTPQVAGSRNRKRPTRSGLLIALVVVAYLGVFAGGPVLLAQNPAPLDQVHVPPPPPPGAAPGAAPGSKDEKPVQQPAPLEGAAALKARANERIRVDVDLTLIPVTVTDPMNRLVTGLEKENFFISEKGTGSEQYQTIKTFSTEDAPVSLGIILDLSGSMTSKFNRSRQSIRAFLKTANPQDEFFVVAFNDRPELIEDFTSSVDDVDARLAMTKPGKRTALLDAIYFGVNKMKDAKYARKALLVVSDGGDNRSRYTEGEVKSIVRESDVQMYSIGIFDEFAPTTEERLGPLLLNDLCEETGGRLFRVNDLSDMADVASKISDEIRDEYVLGYRSTDTKRDGKWRKVKVRLEPPPGLPLLTVHARSGYYAPAQ
ncbi:VWA domain-containing protein [Acidipila sp. EB88]|uniref:VWA domain-containing protein n=1 Tax=Acidipila sp. EB88 TaxID=2305226 RepID=UPI000F5E641D|nr:VWA domain-containing protein [Acidipila sp. EB88]RRA48889.1 VWA domain-containing protein [Acidipila sp. EB88]